MLDLNTFGSMPAAVRIAEMANEKGYNTRRLTRFLNSFNRTLKELEKIDTKVAVPLSKMLLKNYRMNCNDFPVPFNTYLENVLNTTHKIWGVKNNIQVPYKLRKK